MAKSKKQLQQELFGLHLEDLRGIVSTLNDTFVCPICLTLFAVKDIQLDKLSVGDVWPKYYRERNKATKHQQVLLCKNCNSRAGKAGDALMPLDTQLTKGQQSGELGLRNIQVMSSVEMGEPIYLEAYIRQVGEREITIGIPKYTEPSTKMHYERQWQKVKELESKGPISITAFAPRGKPTKPFGDPQNYLLAQAGFLTSAYLFAFYRFGYHFILQTSLNPVREYILASFDKEVDDRLRFDVAKDMCVQTCNEPECFCEVPQIYLVLPTDGNNNPIHQEVAFLYYRIRLPVSPDWSLLERRNAILDLAGLEELPTQDGEVAFSVALQNVFSSKLDHPLLNELQSLSAGE